MSGSLPRDRYSPALVVMVHAPPATPFMGYCVLPNLLTI